MRRARTRADACWRLQEESLSDRETLDVARRVLRQALDHCLEGRELRTRTVARSMTRRG